MKQSSAFKVFSVFNMIFLACVTFICVAPLLNMLAMSLSSNEYVLAGEVGLWPKGFTTSAYEFLSKEVKFWNSLWITVQRLLLGTVINMIMVILVAYPLSKEREAFRARTAYVWFFAITMFFGGGLMPTYFVVLRTGLMDSLWALILPGAVSAWNAVMLLNFFRGIPKELEEAALLDGAGHMTILIRIYLPVSLPALATILLFTAVGHWNSWFDGFIYMNSAKNYPLQTYLSTLVMQADLSQKKFITEEELRMLANVSNKSLKIAQIFMGALPIMLVYPFLQRFFIKGIVVGSVKG